MTSIKAITRKLSHHTKEAFSNLWVTSQLTTSFHELLGHLGHFIGIFFRHRSTKQIGFSECKARKYLGNLHNLFLIEHDAISRLEDWSNYWINQIYFFLTILTSNEIICIIASSRTVKRGCRYDFFELSRFNSFKEVYGTRLLKLKNPLGLTTGKKC